jgi:hypothetical protein
MFEERLQRLAQDFAQQHLADQKLPAHERRAVTLVLAQRSWLFAGLREQLRQPLPAQTAAGVASSAP